VGPAIPPADVGADDEVDHSLAHIGGGARTDSRKGRVQAVAWDPALEALQREKDAADAQRGAPPLIRCTGACSCALQSSSAASARPLREEA
jgi:hypothetical protein